MEHARIDENQLAELYVMGKLADAERQNFEEHFLDCPLCVEKLESVESLRAALKELPVAAFAAIPRTAADRFSPPRARPFVALLAAACLLVAAGASLFFYGEARRARRELAAARQESDKSRLRQADLEGALGRERASRPARSAEAALPDTLAAAPLSAAVFMLNLTRSASPEPGDRVTLPDAAGWVVLLFDRPDRPDVRSYRVRISTDGGRSLGEPMAAGPASGGMLAVSVPSRLLPPGDYRLAVEDGGSGNPLTTYRFRAVAAR